MEQQEDKVPTHTQPTVYLILCLFSDGGRREWLEAVPGEQHGVHPAAGLHPRHGGGGAGRQPRPHGQVWQQREVIRRVHFLNRLANLKNQLHWQVLIILVQKLTVLISGTKVIFAENTNIGEY